MTISKLTDGAYTAIKHL